ncbi:transposable element Tcb2 transposase [Trichonephila clavipes]|nr:transposable element Tcb2 transposase [Trichonephila clavipes]
MMVMFVDVRALVAPELQRRMRTDIWQLLPKGTEGAPHQTCLVSSLQLPWSCVMFSDKSRFSLQSNSRRTLIWRAPGTRYHQENTIERHCYGGAGWLVFGEELFLVPELTWIFRV